MKKRPLWPFNYSTGRCIGGSVAVCKCFFLYQMHQMWWSGQWSFTLKQNFLCSEIYEGSHLVFEYKEQTESVRRQLVRLDVEKKQNFPGAGAVQPWDKS